ncbi:MAG TPA: hypothetical protein PKD85_13045 [Saprospiraceae bacterium]|nr:hypothetical protein [Saprospiraceae bacterium]
MRRILITIASTIIFYALNAQVNFKVGYSYFRPDFTSLNNAFTQYNSNQTNLVEGFGKTSSISALDLGLRIKFADILGLEIGGKYGQSGINRATFSSSSEKWSTRFTELNGALVLHFNTFSFGSSLNRNNLAITRNEPATRKYPVVDETAYWSSTFFVAFEADSGKSSISIRPFYQMAFSGISINNTEQRLGVQSTSNAVKPSGFGISLIIFNGQQ